MSVRAAPAGIDQKMLHMALAQADQDPTVDLSAGASEELLGEGTTGFPTSQKETPLNRKVTVTIRASLAELSTNPQKATWSPSKEQLENIYQHKQFVDLSGETKKQGDLGSVVLHSVEAKGVQSTFPISVGARITGVDEKSYSSLGNAFSMIALPNAKGGPPIKLQEEDTHVAYDFARRYPVNLTRKDSNSSSHPMSAQYPFHAHSVSSTTSRSPRRPISWWRRALRILSR